MQRRLERNHVLIPSHAEMVSVVSIVILDEGTRLQKEKGALPGQPFGILRLRPGKSLAVIAGYEPEGDLRENVDEVLKVVVSTHNLRVMEVENLTIV